jgi:hypothetical protein
MFQILDTDDGFVVEILHTEEGYRLPLKGTIQGLPGGFKNVGRMMSAESRTAGITFGSSTVRIPRGVLVATTLLFGVLMVASAIFVPAAPIRAIINEGPSRAPMLVAGASYIVLSLIMLWKIRRKYPRSLRTDSFE